MSCSELDAPASHASLGKLVGVSKQAIQKRAADIGLEVGAPLRTWLLQYSDHLQTMPAGRAGDNDGRLTSIRIEEAQEKTLSLKISNNKELKSLVLSSDVVEAFSDLGRTFCSSIEELENKIVDAVTSKYEIDLDDEIVAGPIRSAAARCANTAEELGRRFMQSSEGDCTE